MELSEKKRKMPTLESVDFANSILGGKEWFSWQTITFSRQFEETAVLATKKTGPQSVCKATWSVVLGARFSRQNIDKHMHTNPVSGDVYQYFRCKKFDAFI